MKTFLAIVVFFMVGGILATLMDNEYRKQCGHGLDGGSIAAGILIWPAVPFVLILSNADSDGEYECEATQ